MGIVSGPYDSCSASLLLRPGIVGLRASNAEPVRNQDPISMTKYLLELWEGHTPLKIPITAVMGPVRSIKIIPREKIWTPEPEK